MSKHRTDDLHERYGLRYRSAADFRTQSVYFDSDEERAAFVTRRDDEIDVLAYTEPETTPAPVAHDSDFVNTTALDACSLDELHEIVRDGGPAAVIDAARALIAERSTSTTPAFTDDRDVALAAYREHGHASAVVYAPGRATPSCTCDYEDDGDGESGPHLSCTRVDEQCPTHGRHAMPVEWHEHDKIERAYVLSSVASAINMPGLMRDAARVDVEQHEQLVLAMHATAYASLDEQIDDDGHNHDRASTIVARALRLLLQRQPSNV